MHTAMSGCTEARPTSAAGWQQLYDSLPFYGDGMFSTALPSGGSLWTTGDAIRRGGGPWASSTLTVVDDCGVRQLAGPAPSAAGGVDWWAGPSAVAGGRLVVLGSLIRRTPGEGFGFAGVGTQIRTYTVPAAGGLPRETGRRPAPASPAGVRWSAGAWNGGPDGWLYVWGTTEGRPGEWGSDVFLARVDQRTLTMWRYWTGTAWSTSAGAVRPVLRAVDGMGADTAFSVRRDAAGWHLYTRRGGAWGGEHGEYVGGPQKWTWRPYGTEPGYLASAHDEVRLSSGRRLVTVNVDGAGARFLDVAR